jgi:hypothetical protein
MDKSHGDFRSMFLDALRTALDVPQLSDATTVALEARVAELMRSAPADIPPLHTESCAWFAAAFELVRAGDDARGISALNQVVDMFGPEVSTYTAKFLDEATDPFLRMVQESKDRERNYFGDAFAFERPVDDADAYHLHITECAYHRTFKAWELPQLTGLFCRIDEAWIKGIAQRHGIVFARPTTIGWGHDRCRFHFERLRKPQ